MDTERVPGGGSSLGLRDGSRGGSSEQTSRPAETAGQGHKVRSGRAPTSLPRSTPPKAGSTARGQSLELLARVKAATTEQARALLTPNANSPTYVLRALNDLQRQGLVDSVPIGRARHKAWYLSRDGAAALNADGHTPKAGRRVRPLRASTAGNGLIHHALAITQVIADLAPVGAALADWELEAVHRWLPGSDQGRLIADAVLTRSWESDELPPVMMVEVDRTDRIFTSPSDPRTDDYITGRFG